MNYSLEQTYLQLDFLSMRARGWSSTRAIGDIFLPETSFGKVRAFRRQVFTGKNIYRKNASSYRIISVFGWQETDMGVIVLIFTGTYLRGSKIYI